MQRRTWGAIGTGCLRRTFQDRIEIMGVPRSRWSAATTGNCSSLRKPSITCALGGRFTHLSRTIFSLSLKGGSEGRRPSCFGGPWQSLFLVTPFLLYGLFRWASADEGIDRELSKERFRAEQNRESAALRGSDSPHGLHLQSLILPLFASFLLTPSHVKLGLLSQEAYAPAPTNFAGAAFPFINSCCS